MNLNNDVVYCRLRLGPLHQLRPGRSRSPIRHHNRLHRSPPVSSSCLQRSGSIQAWEDGLESALTFVRTNNSHNSRTIRGQSSPFTLTAHNSGSELAIYTD